ncbi:hypothetical protein [Streptomyces sp. NBC_00344]|uniref:hypothetical protein n=1 Tax=Streptomyces sp. NBC_00344 TaxID=2975720 RepID=UPI002E1DC3D9
MDALRLRFRQLATYGSSKHGAPPAMEATTRADLGSHFYPPVAAALDQLLTAFKAPDS